MVVGDNEIDDDGKCRRITGNIDCCGCGSTMRGALTDGSHPGLQWKPLDAVMGRVPAAAMVDNFVVKHKNTNKTQLMFGRGAQSTTQGIIFNS